MLPDLPCLDARFAMQRTLEFAEASLNCRKTSQAPFVLVLVGLRPRKTLLGLVF